uniref:Uncharacterized protein n=1 Tax=Anguilla anguilla TaxID=7936 RepID=A0A0E9XEJ4_ANGAN
MIDTGVNGNVSRLSTCVWITKTHFKTKCKQGHQLAKVSKAQARAQIDLKGGLSPCPFALSLDECPFGWW